MEKENVDAESIILQRIAELEKSKRIFEVKIDELNWILSVLENTKKAKSENKSGVNFPPFMTNNAKQKD